MINCCKDLSSLICSGKTSMLQKAINEQHILYEIMNSRQFIGLTTCCSSEELVSEANTKNGFLYIECFPQIVNSSRAYDRIPWSVTDKYSIHIYKAKPDIAYSFTVTII